MTSARLNRTGAPSGASERAGEINPFTCLTPTDLKEPKVTEDLIGYLNTVYPDRLSLIDKMGSIEAAKGARTVIAHLIELFTEQQKKKKDT